MCIFSIPPDNFLSSLWSLTRYPTNVTQFCSDTVYLESVSDPRGYCSVLQLPTFNFRHQHQVQVVTGVSKLDTEQRLSNPLLGVDSCARAAHRVTGLLI